MAAEDSRFYPREYFVVRRGVRRMKTINFKWAPIIILAGAALTACGTRKLSIVDKINLGSTAMRFDHEGAELSECTLVAQLERGRSSGTSGGGTG